METSNPPRMGHRPGEPGVEFERFFHLSLELLCIANLDGYFVELNGNWERALGYSLDELKGKPFLDFVHPDDKQKTLLECESLAAGNKTVAFENRYRAKDGSYRWLSWSSVASLKTGLIYAAARDVTGRKAAEEADRSLFSQNPNPMLRVGGDGTILYANDAALPILAAWGAARGQRVPGVNLELIRRALRSGRSIEQELSFGATTFLLVAVPAPGGVIHLYGVDVTKQKSAERQFLQAQRMEATGRLAAGIVHDFNNVLTAILGFTGFLKSGENLVDEQRSDLQEIEAAARRAGELTKRLLAFSRKQVLEARVIDLNDLLEGLRRMLIRILPSDIDLATYLDPGAGRVRVDPAQLEQVVLNLVVNAGDAMERGGKLTIETAAARLDERYALDHPGVQPGEYALLSVGDTGAGMPAEIKDRIFEPFFTTKEKGKGTGLGLAVVYGVVRQSGGHVEVQSEPGRGTTFKVYLPAVREAEDRPPVEPMPGPPKGGNEIVLLVEDGAPVQEIAFRTLTDYGYLVLAYGSAEEALKGLVENRHEPHLLVADIGLPGMDGIDLAQKVRSLLPGIKVLLISGYTERALERNQLLDGKTKLLAKPFTPDALAKKARETLDSK